MCILFISSVSTYQELAMCTFFFFIGHLGWNKSLLFFRNNPSSWGSKKNFKRKINQKIIFFNIQVSIIAKTLFICDDLESFYKWTCIYILNAKKENKVHFMMHLKAILQIVELKNCRIIIILVWVNFNFSESSFPYL